MIRPLPCSGRRARRGASACLLGLLAAGAALAQTPAGDSSLPIEITADRLEVAQKQALATFSGNVDAVQGDLVLRADQLKVHYRGSGGEAAAAAVPASAPGDPGAIRRIEAEGHVFLSSPTETAEGNAGVYDVAARQVTLQGDVVLTRGENVIRGDRLEMDLATGLSRMLAAEGGDAKAPGGRVRALFAPEPAKPADQAGPAGGLPEPAAGPKTGLPRPKLRPGAAGTP